jgi:hypothetical protein
VFRNNKKNGVPFRYTSYAQKILHSDSLCPPSRSPFDIFEKDTVSSAEFALYPKPPIHAI